MIDPRKLSPIDLRNAAGTLRDGLLAFIMDSTLLAPTASTAAVEELVDEAVQLKTHICVSQCRVADAAKRLAEFGNRTKGLHLAGVVGFPHGATSTRIKVEEMRELLSLGATEGDMVANVGLLKDGNQQAYADDIDAVAAAIAEFNAANSTNCGLKVIIETCYLNDTEKEFAAATTAEIGLRRGIPIFVKTSTGFGQPAPGVPVGATVDDVLLLRRTVGDYCAESNPVGVKASGGVRTATDAVKMALAGGGFDENLRPRPHLHAIVRIGTSSAAAILRDFEDIYASRGWLSPSSY